MADEFAAVCSDCGEAMTDMENLVEAFEVYGVLMCAICFDERCEEEGDQ